MADLAKHATFPQIWTNTTPTPNRKCVGCPVATAASHATCVGMEATSAAPVSTRLDLTHAQKHQYLNQRKQRDAKGLYGWEDGFLYNARDSFNYADYLAGDITSVNGNNITVTFATDPTQATLYQTRVVEPELGMGYINGIGGFGVPQPGMILQFMSPSVLMYKARPTVKAIVSRSGNAVTFELDQNVSSAMTSFDNTTPAAYTVRLWHQWGNPEVLLDIQPPTLFRGLHKTRIIGLARLDVDGFYTLASAAVAHPGGFNGDAFSIEGWNGGWVTVPDASSRLFIRRVGSGYTSVIALGSAKPAYAAVAGTLTDLRTTYTSFRIKYWLETDAADAACGSPCYDRCKHARRDYTNSVHNYGAANGTAVDVSGNHWYCSQRKYVTYTYEDTDADGLADTAVATWNTPTGVATFHPRCKQHGTCNHFTPSENGTDNTSFFDYRHHASKVYREIWGAWSTRLRQKFPGYSQHWNFVVERVATASLMSNCGDVDAWANDTPMTSRTGFHARITFPVSGYWGTKSITYTLDPTDPAASQRLRFHTAGDYDTFLDPDLLPGTARNKVLDGAYPEIVASFGTGRDPLTAPYNYIDPDTGEEVTHQLEGQKHIPRLGVRYVRDDGAVTEAGLALWPKAHPDAPLICPDVSTTLTGEVQDRTVATFERFAAPQGFHTLTAGGRLAVLPLRQADKSEASIGNRVIQSASYSAGIVTLDLENDWHDFVYVKAGFPGMNTHMVWEGGGVYPLKPADPYIVDSVEEPNNHMGAPVIERGDCAAVSLAGYEDMRFLLTAEEPHGGAEAASWGGEIVHQSKFEAGGYFRAAEANTGSAGVIEAPATGLMVADTAGVVTFTRNMSIARPETLSSGQFWVDIASNRIFFSPSQDGVSVTIRYQIEDGDGTIYSESYTIDTTVATVTDITWADWSAAASKTVTRDDNGAAVSYTASDNGGQLQLLITNGNAAGRILKVRTETAGTTPAPWDTVNLMEYGYLSYGKKRDRVKLRDESGVLAANLGALVGQSITFYRGAGVFVPDTVSLKWAEFGTETWTAVPAADYISEHGRGYFWIAESWFAGKPARLCFKV